MKVFIIVPSGANYFRDKQKIRDEYSKKCDEKIVCPKAFMEGNKDEIDFIEMLYNDLDDMRKSDVVVFSHEWTWDKRCRILWMIANEYKDNFKQLEVI